jgi:hypothetical protein
MNNQDMQLNPDTDSYIIIKYMGPQSAAFQIYPVNVSPAQMFAATEMLKWQATKQINEAYEARQGSRKLKIAVPEPGTIVKDAK